MCGCLGVDAYIFDSSTIYQRYGNTCKHYMAVEHWKYQHIPNTHTRPLLSFPFTLALFPPSLPLCPVFVLVGGQRSAVCSVFISSFHSVVGIPLVIMLPFPSLVLCVGP